MPLVNPYCSLAQLQGELKNADTAPTAWLEDCINQASRYVDEWRGRDYYQHDYSTNALLIRGGIESRVYGETLELPYWPVIQLTEVKDADTVLVAETDYVLVQTGDDMRPDELIRVEAEWGTGIVSGECIAIKGKFGYAQASSSVVPTGIPGNITKATSLLAAVFSNLYQREIISADGMRDRISSNTIPPQVATLLGNRARRVFV